MPIFDQNFANLTAGANGGSGGGSTVDLSMGVPNNQATVAAYLAALGFENTAAQENANQQIANVNAQADYQRPELEYQGQLAQDAVNQDALGRGIFSSGERQLGLARAAHATQYDIGKLALGQSQSVADAQLALAHSLAQNEARKQTILAQQSDAAASAGGGSSLAPGYDYGAYG